MTKRGEKITSKGRLYTKYYSIINLTTEQDQKLKYTNSILI